MTISHPAPATPSTSQTPIQTPIFNPPSLNDSLPEELILNIFYQVGQEQDLRFCASVCHLWRKIVDEKLIQASVPSVAFGKEKWEKYIGSVGAEPSLPKDIHQILESDCPIWYGRKVKETHMLVLVPEKINNMPLTSNALERFVKSPKNGNPTQYDTYDINRTVIKQFGDIPAAPSHWVLMTKAVLPNSGRLSYTAQQQLVADFSKRINVGYQIPHRLDAIVCIIMEFLDSGVRLFSDSPTIYTRCQETESASGDQVIVGNFKKTGLDITSSSMNYHANGIAACRKL